MADPKQFNKKVKAFWLRGGTEEDWGQNGNKAFHQTLNNAGIKNVYYESPVRRMSGRLGAGAAMA